MDACGLSQSDFLRQAQALLPRGPAWPRDPDAILTLFWSAVADEYARLNARACELLQRESFPCSALEMLSDWERALGLPDPCFPVAGSIAGRQANVCFKLTTLGGQSKAYIIAVAALLGWQIEIVEHFGFRVGMGMVGCDAIETCPFWWTVRVLNAPPVVYFRVGCSSVCDPLCSLPDLESLYCVINRAKPAHTVVTYELVEPVPDGRRITVEAWNRVVAEGGYRLIA